MRREVRLRAGRTLQLDDGLLEPYRARLAAAPDAPPVRLAYAATRLVLRDDYAAAPDDADLMAAIEWSATADLRRRLAGLGFGVAEAMDTAQRFEIGWDVARRLIEATGALGLAHGFVAGAGSDHLEGVGSAEELLEAVVYQARLIQAAGGEVILLPMPWLSVQGCDAQTYVSVYARIVEQLEGPLYVHWLGAMFLPQLRGYFPGDSFARVMDLDPAKLRGAKLSLLDADLEVRLRRELRAREQLLLTGDDLNFAGLILGGELGARALPAVEGHTRVGARSVALGDFSHALLGVLDAVAEPVSLALRFLARGDAAGYLALMEPCEQLGRWLFQPPTQHYKCGLAFLAWLNGLQSNPMLARHAERARDREHYLRAAELAAAAGALGDVTLAAERLALY